MEYDFKVLKLLYLMLLYLSTISLLVFPDVVGQADNFLQDFVFVLAPETAAVL